MNPLFAIDFAAQPHVVAVALIAARLLPTAFLCPLLGGAQAPMHVKLSLVLCLAVFFHAAGGVDAPALLGVFELLGAVGRELMLGVVIGLLAALPFDLARMSGRFLDTFRGASAEASLPLVGSREAATGDVLHQMLLAAGCVALMPSFISAFGKGFMLISLGAFVPTDRVALECAAALGVAFSTALAIGAPVAGLSLAVDLGLGFASRVTGGVNLQDLAPAARILGGGAVVWLSIGLVFDRLLTFALESQQSILVVVSP